MMLYKAVAVGAEMDASPAERLRITVEYEIVPAYEDGRDRSTVPLPDAVLDVPCWLLEADEL